MCVYVCFQHVCIRCNAGSFINAHTKAIYIHTRTLQLCPFGRLAVVVNPHAARQAIEQQQPIRLDKMKLGTLCPKNPQNHQPATQNPNP